MSEGSLLFLILALLYSFDCLLWVRKRSVLFVSPWCRRWRTKSGSRLAGNDNGGLAFLNPLPPLGRVFAGFWIPVSISPAGVSNTNLRTVGTPSLVDQSCRTLPFDQVRTAGHDDRWLLINGDRFARCGSADQARALAELVKHAGGSPAAGREKIITGFIRRSFSKADAAARLELTGRVTAWVRRTCIVFFLFLYVAVPLTACLFPLGRVILPVAVVMWAAAAAVAVQYYRAHRILHPARRGERIMTVIQMILCPPVAIRACDLVSLEAMQDFHPVLTARMLLGDESHGFCCPVVRDLQHPLRWDRSDAQTLEVASWFARAELAAITGFLETGCARASGECRQQPVWDGVSTGYCPRCLCQFNTAAGECPDCPGVQRRPVSGPDKKESA
ncbi:MAG: hypothetical protein WCL44_00570 [bacterium]